ncbi:hypothetical protein [Burkholderia gladioli]|uniref:hypothetical protein n=1 Tax=Burkholderia gladioli TaxID=28095 RepID=UPI0011B23B62|nr:hypothetical protein [Burkholderia gladioli]
MRVIDPVQRGAQRLHDPVHCLRPRLSRPPQLKKLTAEAVKHDFGVCRMFEALNAIVRMNLLCLGTSVILVLIVFITSEDVSRPGAILLGALLIAQAGWTAYQIQIHWLSMAESLADPKVAAKYRLTSAQLQAFESSVSFFLWVIPFATASWGTNIISDAVARNFTYRQKWTVPGFLGRAILGLVAALWSLLTLPGRLWRNPRPDDVESVSLPRQSTALRRSSHMLLTVLADMPQFNRGDRNDRLVNMLDGSIVQSVRLDEDEFGCFLSVKWPNGESAMRVDGARYVRLQIRTAESLGHNTAGLRSKAEAIIEDILSF